MVATSSRILSCAVWLILMRNTSAPASNSLRIIGRSDDAGPRVARILIRRRRLIVSAPRLAAERGQPPGRLEVRLEVRLGVVVRPATGPARRRGRQFPEFPVRAAARVVHWLRSIARSM